MSKTKIKLYFEDNIWIGESGNVIDNLFFQEIKNKYSDRYEISNELGKIGLKSGRLYFKESPKRKSEDFFPSEYVSNTNISSNYNYVMPGLREDEIPFFVIDTDGIEPLNLSSKILGLESSGKQKNLPIHWISGYNNLLPELLQSIVDEKILSQWGLILVNPNKEGFEYSSVIRENNSGDFNDILFGKKAKNGKYYGTPHIGFSYFNKGGVNNRFLKKPFTVNKFGSLGDDILMTAFYDSNKVICKELISIIPNLFSFSISEDISEHYKLIVDEITKSNIELTHDNYKNAEASVFGIYVRKAKKKNFSSLPIEYLDKGISQNLIIELFDFSELMI